MTFEFATAGQIIFGNGTISRVGQIAAGMGKKTLISSGVMKEHEKIITEILSEKGVSSIIFPVTGEPSIELLRKGVDTAKKEGCDIVIGFGGGSAMDTGKAIAAMLTNPGEVLDYLEVIGRGKSISVAPAPYIAIPTTAGTGAEVTRNAVLGSEEHKVKVSMRSPLMLAKVVIVDPELTYSLPPAVTASTGLDALTQVLEPFVSNAANPLTDSICREGLMRAARSLKKAFDNGKDAYAREDMAITSLFGGIALANSKLGAVHGFAGVLGGMFPAPHGMVCAVLLPNVIDVNIKALGGRKPDSDYLKRYAEAAKILTGNVNASAEDGSAWVKKLCADLKVPGLGNFGLSKNDFKTVIEKSSVASSMKGNPLELTYDEMEEILEKSL